VVSIGRVKESFDLAKRVCKRVFDLDVRMSSLLPIRSEPSTGDDEPRVVDLDGEEADEVFSALSSSTAREIVTALHDEPRTQSEIAEEIDTTVQNVRYHLDKLEDAGLVEVVDTWYSSRGNEMAVYAPADGALIVAGNDRQRSRIRTAISRLVGGVAIIGLASLLIQSLFGRSLLSASIESAPKAGDRPSDSGDGDTARSPESVDQADAETQDGDAGLAVENTSAQTTRETNVSNDGAFLNGNETVDATTTQGSPQTVEPTTTAGAAGAADPGLVGGLPPGALFFLGGLSVLVVVVAVAYWSSR
jgi:DNA-binding transcriptional ArsR family regulator